MPNAVARALFSLTLPMLLFACSQPTTSASVEGTAPARQQQQSPSITAQALTPGVNTLQYERATFMRNGWGPAERNTSNGEQRAGDGHPITLNGRVYAQGYGVHAGSDLRFDLAGAGAACTRFTADVGVDDEVGGAGSVVFEVFVDGARKWVTPTVTGAEGAQSIDVSVSGARELRLVLTDAGDGVRNDHADWADPKIECRSGPLPGAPDPTFQPIRADFRVADAAVQVDGKVLVFGQEGAGGRLVVARFTVDGLPDEAFGERGRATRALRGVTAAQVLALADGGALLRAVGPDAAVLWRLQPDGQPDRTFGDEGVLVVPLGADRVLTAGVQADGKVVLAGVTADQYGDRLLLRRLPDGAPDAAFGEGGRAVTPGPRHEQVSALAFGADGVILAAGQVQTTADAPGYTAWQLTRYQPDGRALAGDGAAVLRLHGATQVGALAVQAGGSVVMGGSGPRADGCLLARATPDGQPDPAFHAPGDLGNVVNLGNARLRGGPVGVTLGADGTVLVSGCARDAGSGPAQPVLVRLRADGAYDTRFGEGGVLDVPDAQRVLRQPGGRLLVGLNPIVRLWE